MVGPRTDWNACVRLQEFLNFEDSEGSQIHIELRCGRLEIP